MTTQHEARAAWHRWAESRKERERAALADGAPLVGNAWRHVPGARAAAPDEDMVGGYTMGQWAALLAWTHRTNGRPVPWETTSSTRPSTRYGTR